MAVGECGEVVLPKRKVVLLLADLSCSQPLCQFSVASILRVFSRGVAGLVDDSGVGFGIKQMLHHCIVAIDCSPMQRGLPIVVHCIDVGLSLDEVCHPGLAIVGGGPMKRSPPIVIRDVDVGLKKWIVCKDDGILLRLLGF